MRAFDAATDAAAAAAAAIAAGGGGGGIDDEGVWFETLKGAVNTDGAAGMYGGVGEAQNGVAGSKNGAADVAAAKKGAAMEDGVVTEKGAAAAVTEKSAAAAVENDTADEDGGREERRFPIEISVEVDVVDGVVVREKCKEEGAIIDAGKERRGAGRNEDVFGSRWVVILGGGAASRLGWWG